MRFLIILVGIGILTSCNWFKQKAKDTVNKSGEIVAKTGSEFADGVSKGVQKTFQNTVTFSDKLQKEGLKAGRIIINSSGSSVDNILTAYLIFDNDIDENVTVKVFDENGQEYVEFLNKLQDTKEKQSISIWNLTNERTLTVEEK